METENHQSGQVATEGEVRVGMSLAALVFYYGIRILALILTITLVVHIVLGFEVVTSYLWGSNFAGFFLFGFDKKRVQVGGLRVPEATFYLVALLGASMGSFIGMRYFRHKTLKHRFQFFLFVTLILHFSLGYALYL